MRYLCATRDGLEISNAGLTGSKYNVPRTICVCREIEYEDDFSHMSSFTHFGAPSMLQLSIYCKNQATANGNLTQTFSFSMFIIKVSFQSNFPVINWKIVIPRSLKLFTKLLDNDGQSPQFAFNYLDKCNRSFICRGTTENIPILLRNVSFKDQCNSSMDLQYHCGGQQLDNHQRFHDLYHANR